MVEVEAANAVNRFNYTFQNFVQTFIAPEHPLVIFLDDLQWADSASFNLIELMLKMNHLLLIGAYRDNEVDATHPLKMAIEKWQISNDNYLTLTPLDEPAVNALLTETLYCSADESQPLAQLCANPPATNAVH